MEIGELRKSIFSNGEGRERDVLQLVLVMEQGDILALCLAFHTDPTSQASPS